MKNNLTDKNLFSISDKEKKSGSNIKRLPTIRISATKKVGIKGMVCIAPTFNELLLHIHTYGTATLSVGLKVPQ